MKILLLFLLLSFAFLRATDIPVSGTVRDAVDSSGVNGRITVIIGRDSTVLPVVDGAYSGTVTDIKSQPALPEGFDLKVYPSVLAANHHTITARLLAPLPIKKDEVKLGVFNLLGQKVDVQNSLAFQPLIVQVRFKDRTLSRLIFAAAPFELRTVLQTAAAKGRLKKVMTDSVQAVFNIRADGYLALRDTLRLALNGENVHRFFLQREMKTLSCQMFNQRGLRIENGTIRLFYQHTVDTVNVDQGHWQAKLPAVAGAVKLLFDHKDYGNGFLAIQRKGQKSWEKNIGQASLTGPIGKAIMDTARISLGLPDTTLKQLEIYAVADTAMNDTIKEVINGETLGLVRWTEGYTIEILTRDLVTGDTVPEDRTQARIRIVKDYLKALTLINGKKLLEGVKYILSETPTKPGETPQWVHMYRNNTAGPGHYEITYYKEGKPSVIKYGNNHVDHMSDRNDMGEEFYGNVLRNDPEDYGYTLGSFCLNKYGFLEPVGKDMIGIVFLFNPGTRFRQ